MGDRLQKLLARAGLGSRRKLEEAIAAGALVINGRPATLGEKADVGDRIRFEKQRYRVIVSDDRDARLIAYHKPVGRVTSRSDEQNRPTVFEHLPRLRGARWVAIGRLDINTSGLLIFTDNGDLAHRLMHPSFEIEREYACRIRGEVSQEDIARLSVGVELEDGAARFNRCVFDGGSENNQWYRVVLNEGKNREVRRLWEALGYQVSRLIRVRYGPVRLPSHLRLEKFRDVVEHEADELFNAVGMRRSSKELKLVADRTKPGRGGYGSRSGRYAGKRSPRRSR